MIKLKSAFVYCMLSPVLCYKGNEFRCLKISSYLSSCSLKFANCSAMWCFAPRSPHWVYLGTLIIRQSLRIKCILSSEASAERLLTPLNSPFGSAPVSKSGTIFISAGTVAHDFFGFSHPLTDLSRAWTTEGVPLVPLVLLQQIQGTGLIYSTWGINLEDDFLWL